MSERRGGGGRKREERNRPLLASRSGTVPHGGSDGVGFSAVAGGSNEGFVLGGRRGERGRVRTGSLERRRDEDGVGKHVPKTACPWERTRAPLVCLNQERDKGQGRDTRRNGTCRKESSPDKVVVRGNLSLVEIVLVVLVDGGDVWVSGKEWRVNGEGEVQRERAPSPLQEATAITGREKGRSAVERGCGKRSQISPSLWSVRTSSPF